MSKKRKLPRLYTALDMRKEREKGRREMEEFLQHRITRMIHFNYLFVHEVMRLDLKSPVTGIVLTYRFAESLVKRLRKNNMSYTAKQIQKMIDNSNQIDAQEVLVIIEDMNQADGQAYID